MARRGDIDGTQRRSPAVRVLAPLALVLAAVVLIAVVSASLGGGDDPSADGSRSGGGDQSAETTTEKTKKPPKEYVVQPGDSVSVIADRFGVPVVEVLELNPDIDPQALVTGEALKLR